MATQIGKASQEATRAEAADTTPPAGEVNGQAMPTALSSGKPSHPVADSPNVAQAPERVLATFGHYELLEELAVGGMGVVYRARDTNLGRVVALKMIRAGALAHSEEIQRFQREARAAAALHHPHIIEVYEVGEQDSRHYFTMALVEGGSLDKQLARFAEVPAAVTLMEKVARAVQHAHERGVLHRDLKPANVLLDGDEPRVCDFGLAKMTDTDVELTRTGQFLGTPAYAAPEQATEHPGRVTKAADMWSLGVILYKLLAGRRPFDATNRDEMLRQIRTCEPSPPSRYRPEVDPALDAIVMQCLAKDPAQRCASAGVLADKLRSWLHDEATVTKRSHVSPRPASGRRLPVIGGVALAILFLIGLAVGATFPSTDSGPSPGGSQPLDAPIVLIGDQGPPPWSNLIWGSKFAVFPGQPNEPFAFGSRDTSVLELMSSVPWESYRFEAEVLHDPTQPGEVGLFVGHSPHPASPQPTRTLVSVGFRDHIPENPRDSRFFWVFMWPMEEANDPDCSGLYLPAPDESLFGRLPQPANTWRPLAVEVTPEEFRIFWQGLQVLRTSRVGIDRLGNEYFLGRERTGWKFDSGKGLGIYVDSRAKNSLATASFRRVTVRPIR